MHFHWCAPYAAEACTDCQHCLANRDDACNALHSVHCCETDHTTACRGHGPFVLYAYIRRMPVSGTQLISTLVVVWHARGPAQTATHT